MFEIPRGKTRKGWTVPLAMMGELSLVVTLAMVPARHVPLPAELLTRVIFAPPPPAAPPPPSATHVRREPVKIAVRQPDPVQLISPVPHAPLPDESAEAAEETTAGVPGGIEGGVPGGVLGGVPGGVLASIPVAPPTVAPPPPPPVVAVRPAPRSPVSVGGDVQAGLLLHQVRPSYPPLAKAGHVTGVVKLAAIITCDGRVRDLTVISGHPLLVKAALEAVRQWLYKPTLLNGEPIEVKTVISLNFQLAYG